MTARAEELAERLRRVRERIERACDVADRDRRSVSLIVVTKHFPATDVAILADLGVTDVGENRHQEAVEKQAACRERGLELCWHFIGGLQSNKAAAVAGYADVVESVDRTKLVAGLDRGAGADGRLVDVLIQVSLDPPAAAGRSGADPSDPAGLDALADAVERAEHLRLRGLMAVAPRDEDPDEAFARLAGVHQSWLDRHPLADRLSAGMSADLEQSISHGATHVRVGSAVLGSRPPVQ